LARSQNNVSEWSDMPIRGPQALVSGKKNIPRYY